MGIPASSGASATRPRSKALSPNPVAALAAELPPDLAITSLHAAIETLGEITGETAAPDLLHEIFSRFCVGK
ncbi:hypothetical protein EON81_23710 [bacterium]|nr:MAG: hypothetical protein EON81_23710 [bacterium]